MTARFMCLVVLSLSVAACAEHSEPTQANRPSSQPATEDVGPGDLPRARLSPVFVGLNFRRPIFLTHAGDGTDRLFVVEQGGKIKVFKNEREVAESTVFLDVASKVYRGHNEEGLLALAFHPDYAENGEFFVYYSAGNPRRGVLSRFTVSTDDPNVADPASETVVLEVPQPWGNHNGCDLAFGPDGYLYMSLGDGGSANDPLKSGQDLTTLLGTILRLDIDTRSADRQYAVPDDNPFVEYDAARPEIYAYGLRNVWRMSFDRETGDLWAGDVGQNRWEEIDLIVAGGNYGWDLREGAHPHRKGETDVTLIDPVVEHPRKEAWSITGGYVYRGTKQPGFVGAYIYGDYVTNRFWALRHDGESLTAHREIIGPKEGTFVASFGEDEAGELYVLGFERYDGRKGTIYRLIER